MHSRVLRLGFVALLIAAFLWPSLAWAQPKPNGPVLPPKGKTWPEQPLTDEYVQQSIRAGIAYLWSRQHPTEFHWEPQTMDQWKKWAKATPKPGPLTVGGMHGGFTALTLVALLRAGVSPEDERFDKAYKWLIEQPMEQVYSRAMRAVLLGSLGPKRVPARLIEEDKRWLLNAAFNDGTYGYFAANANTRALPLANTASLAHWRDLSNTQYGLLGIWLLSDAGAEVPDKYWKLLQRAFLSSQLSDGSWPYVPLKDPAYALHGAGSQSMTLAGLASLFVIWDKTCSACNAQPSSELTKSLESGLGWMAKNFNPATGGAKVFPNQFQMYTLYGVERVGVAGGLKYFGDHNWYVESAKYTLFRQLRDGSWPADYPVYSDPPVSTSYALMFLSYGRAPVIFNKLAYGQPAQWNSRPRDLARLITWMDRTYERLYNWQVMPVDRSVEELLDAPILMMSGRAAISLTAAQKQKLRDYVLGGGLLLGEAADGSQLFANSFRAMIRELFPESELKPLPDTHPIYSVQFPVKSTVQPLEGLSNGVRMMVLLSPKDLGCAWQQHALASAKSAFELAGNLVQYVSDKGNGLLGRGASYMAADLGVKPTKTITVGRLAWGGATVAWDPEPAGWKRMDVLVRNGKGPGIATTQTDLSAALDPAAVPLLHVTGTSAIRLTDAQKANLKNYVNGGGLLLADAAGGSKLFSESFDKLASELFAPLVVAAPDWLIAVVDAKGGVAARHIDGLPRAIRPIPLLGWQQDKRWAVLSLPWDLTAAMAGYPNVEPVGLTPQSAEAFVAALTRSLAGMPTSQPSK